MHMSDELSVSLSVVVPCYNEERNIRLGALENLAHYLKKTTWKYEVILVNDGSSDDSVRLIKEFLKDHPKFSLLNNRHQGKAAAVSSGVMHAKEKIILFTDLDGATPINQVEKLLEFFPKNFDIVIGSRNNKRRGAPIMRLAMARGFMMLRNIILNLHIDDTQCGFKAFRSEVAKNIFPKLKVFGKSKLIKGSTVTAGFDVELLYIAKKNNFRIKEVPVEWHYQETRHVNPLKDSVEGVFDLLRIRLNAARGAYG